MASVARLVTFVDVGDAAAASQISVSARHEAVLADGRCILLLDDRGWSESRILGGDLPAGDPWAETTVAEIDATARVVVGPDEPFGGRSQADMEADHWAYLADILRRQGVIVDPLELERLPHDVVLSEQLRARVRPEPGGPT